jgi:2-polyprenyl-3-methyl-5-hydroxy-6-metoxy-1,4-benzoquinol methylase
MTPMEHEQEVQESQYVFPYHHIPEFGEGTFSIARLLFWGHEYASYLEYLTTLIQKKAIQSLVDIGCGDGRFLLEAHKKLPKETRLLGIDYSAHAIQFAQAFAPDVEYRATGLSDLVRSGERFDAFTLIEVLEHIPPAEIPAFLETMEKVLTPGGFGIITVPSDNLKRSSKHYQHFNTNTLTQTLAAHFTIEHMEYLNGISKTEYLLRRVLANRFYILNNKSLLNWLYRWYKKNYLMSTSDACRRLVAIVKPRS